MNGKKVLVRSAGWTDDIFLRDTPASNEIQVQYVRDMNLNSIRFENIWELLQKCMILCDRYGLLVLVGWSCHWEWDNYLVLHVMSLEALSLKRYESDSSFIKRPGTLVCAIIGHYCMVCRK